MRHNEILTALTNIFNSTQDYVTCSTEYSQLFAMIKVVVGLLRPVLWMISSYQKHSAIIDLAGLKCSFVVLNHYDSTRYAYYRTSFVKLEG